MTSLKESNLKYACGVRDLSLFGKVTIFKSSLLPKVLYIASILPSPLEFIKAFQTMIYKFLWKGPDKVSRTAVIKDFEFGGLKVTDLTTSIRSLRLSWIGRFLSDNLYPRISIAFTKTFWWRIVSSL